MGTNVVTINVHCKNVDNYYVGHKKITLKKMSDIWYQEEALLFLYKP